MPSVQEAFKISGQIVTRLFDHRQFTTGEINYLVEEYQNNHKIEENFDKILKVNENFTNSAFLIMNELLKLDVKVAQDIDTQLSSCQDRAQGLVNVELEHNQRNIEVLDNLRKERSKIKSDIIKKSKESLENLDNALKTEEVALEQKLRQFEESLSKSLSRQ